MQYTFSRTQVISVIVSYMAMFVLLITTLMRPTKISYEHKIPTDVQIISKYKIDLPKDITHHFLIPVSSPNADFCRTFRSALLNDYGPIYLINYGDGHVTKTHKFNRGYKIEGVYNFLRDRTEAGRILDNTDTIKPEYLRTPTSHRPGNKEVVIMIDGFDVVTQLPYHTLLSRFANMRHRIIYGADKGCWPMAKDSAECKEVPESPLKEDSYGELTDHGLMYTRPRWLNSGTVISYSSDLFKLYKAMMEDYDVENVFSDQSIISTYFIERDGSGKLKHDIGLDYYSELFQVMAGSLVDVSVASDFYADEFVAGSSERHRSDLADRQRLFWNTMTGTLPVMVHFNGGMEKMFHKMWWNQTYLGNAARQPEYERILAGKGAYLAHNMTFVKWDELCGKIWAERNHE